MKTYNYRWLSGLKTGLKILVLAVVLIGCTQPDPPQPPTPTPTPQPTPQPTPVVIGDIDSLLRTMSIREKVGQLFYVRPECLDTIIDMQNENYVSRQLRAVNDVMKQASVRIRSACRSVCRHVRGNV